MKFEEIRLSEEVVQRCKWMDRLMTDDGRGVITIAHPEPSAQVS